MATARAAIESGTGAAAHARVEAMLRAHHATLLRIARRWSGSPDAAEDALQRAMEIYVRRLDSLDPATEAAWLKVVVRHEAMAVQRAAAAAIPLEAADLAAAASRSPTSPSRSGSSARSARRTRSRRSGGSSRTSGRRCCSRPRASPIARSASARAGRTRRSIGPSPRAAAASSTPSRGSSRARSASGTRRRSSRSPRVRRTPPTSSRCDRTCATAGPAGPRCASWSTRAAAASRSTCRSWRAWRRCAGSVRESRPRSSTAARASGRRCTARWRGSRARTSRPASSSGRAAAVAAPAVAALLSLCLGGGAGTYCVATGGLPDPVVRLVHRAGEGAAREGQAQAPREHGALRAHRATPTPTPIPAHPVASPPRSRPAKPSRRVPTSRGRSRSAARRRRRSSASRARRARRASAAAADPARAAASTASTSAPSTRAGDRLVDQHRARRRRRAEGSSCRERTVRCPALVALALGALAPPANAGTYDVWSCQLPRSGAPAPIDGWMSGSGSAAMGRNDLPEPTGVWAATARHVAAATRVRRAGGSTRPRTRRSRATSSTDARRRPSDLMQTNASYILYHDEPRSNRCYVAEYCIRLAGCAQVGDYQTEISSIRTIGSHADGLAIMPAARRHALSSAARYADGVRLHRPSRGEFTIARARIRLDDPCAACLGSRPAGRSSTDGAVLDGPQAVSVARHATTDQGCASFAVVVDGEAVAEECRLTRAVRAVTPFVDRRALPAQPSTQLSLSTRQRVANGAHAFADRRRTMRLATGHFVAGRSRDDR